jgi:hypothetical protein
MAVFLITYDLNQEANNRPNITGVLHDAFDSWARLSESSYAVSTSLGAETVYAVFKPLLDENDQLYVIGLRQPVEGQGGEEVNNWLASEV